MNFFGFSGQMNVVDARMRGPHEQVNVKVRPLNSSDEETETSEANFSVASLPRRDKSNLKARNRRDNREFRSIWYDGESEHEDTKSINKLPGKLSLRKATSLGNLLDIATGEKSRGLTKNMISSPLRPRKIQGNWTDVKKEVNVSEADESEDRTHLEMTDPPPIIEDIEYRLPELRIQDNDTVRYDHRKALSMENLFEFDTFDTKPIRKASLDVTTTTIDEYIEMKDLSSGVTDELVVEDSLKQSTGEIKTDVSDRKNRSVEIVEEKPLKKGPSFDNLFKFSTLDGRTKRKNIAKLDISAPIMPRKIEENGDEVPLDYMGTEEVTNLLRMKSKSKSTNELLRSFNHNDKFEHSNDPKFPVAEVDEIKEDVQLRRHRNIAQYRNSKTTDFDFGRRHVKDNDFDIKGCSKILIPNEQSPIKVRKNEIIRYQKGHLYKNDSNSQKILKPNVTLKSARMLNKRDVELKDSNNLSYIIFFDSSKDAKIFIENENVSKYIDNDSKSTITKTLLRLLGKRSSREVLEKKGIYQNEPIFGNTLKDIYRVEKGVPRFILKTMELIERPENIKSLGLYRTSGNLATIQKIRFEVDKGRLDILDDFCKDADVLTGSLKLFFRELKEPLIPCDVCDTLLGTIKPSGSYTKKDKDKIKSVLSKLPEANSETLAVLINHLIKVVRYKEENKMDTYNLSVCWGPTIIFMTDTDGNSHGKDIVTQSTDATRLFDALLTFYTEYPEELALSRRRQEELDDRHLIQRQDSKDSIRSSDSNNSKSQKKYGSNLYLNIDDVLKKSVETIELNINSEGLYKKSGSTEKINKLMKKMTKKKVNELDKYKNDVHELTDCLKKYIREFSEPLATKEVVDQVNKFCDTTPCLEQNTRQRIISVVEDLPKKDTLIYLIRHIIKVMEHESYHNVSKPDMISIWSNVLNYQKRVTDSTGNFSNFLRILLEVFDEKKQDTSSPRAFSNELLDDLKNYQKDKDRCSKYDNVPEPESGMFRELAIPEEKTEMVEYTKL